MDPEPTIEDLGSRNGTTVRQRRLSAHERSPIQVGTLVEIGSAWLVVQATPALPVLGVGSPRPVSSDDDRVIVHDEAMRRVYAMVDLVAPSDLPVLLLGETGVGKEVVARQLHARSSRSPNPFVVINCASIPEALVERELFGHVRGAFTGATENKLGLFEAAHGGTLFLDEVGELPLSLQPKILRAVEQGEITRLGGVRPTRLDVRLVSATNRDLVTATREGQFRADLFFRLSGITIEIPPLRQRPNDIEPLAAYFWGLAAARSRRAPPQLTRETIAELLAYPWPGNIRELRRTIERGVLLGSGKFIDPSQQWVPPTPARSEPSMPTAVAVEPSGAESADLRERVGAFEKECLLEALARTGGNQTRAARLLGLPRRTLLNKLQLHGIETSRGNRHGERK
jgi:transcriptional regulator with GAF, ATPase, and Fis domain